VLPDLVDIDRIGPPQDLQLFSRDLAGATDRQAGAGEGVALDEGFGQSKFTSQGADFVLEQLTQRFDKLEPIFSGRPPTLWWLLIVTDGPPLKLKRFDYVGIKRALREERRAADLMPRVSGTRR
jgi:hypothetical protein